MLLTPLIAIMALAPQANRFQLEFQTFYSYPNIVLMNDSQHIKGLHFKVVTGTTQELMKKIQAFGKIEPTSTPTEHVNSGEATTVALTYIGRTGQKQTERIAVRPKAVPDGVDLEIGVAPRQLQQTNLELPIKAHVPDGQSAAIFVKRYDRQNTMRVYFVAIKPRG